MRTPRLAAAMLGCVVALSLAACGQAQPASLYRAHDDPALRAHVQTSTRGVPVEPTTGQLWSSFQSSLASARTMHVSGTIHVEKQEATVDLSGACDNSNDKSTITLGLQSFEVTTVAGTYYIKANTAYWKARGLTQDQIGAIGSRYLATTDASMGQFNVSAIVSSMKTTQAVSDGMGVIAEKTTLNGHPVYLFSVSTKSGRMTIWVTDTAYTLLKIRVESPDGTDELVFSDWNVPVAFTAPPAAQVIRL